MKPSFLATILYFVKPYPKLVGGIFFVVLLSSLLESLNVAAFFPLFYSILENGTGPMPKGPLSFLIGVARMIPLSDPLISAVALLLGITLIKCISLLVKDSLVAHAGGTVQYDLKNRLMEFYAGSSYPFFLENRQGQLIYNASVGASRVGILVQKAPQLMAEELKVGAIGLLLFTTIPLATLGLMAVGFSYHQLTQYLSKKVSYHTGKGRVLTGAAQTSLANELFTGIRQIMAFGTQPVWLEKFRVQNRLFRDLFIRDSIWLALPKILLELIAVFLLLGSLLVLYLTRPELLAKNLPLWGVFALGLLKLLPSLTCVGQLRMELGGLMADAEGIHHALSNPVPHPKGGNRVLDSLQKGILFKGVGFAYLGRELLFQGMDVTFEKGRVTAIVGSSGSGKSTLAYLILGFLEPTAGKILVDGVDLREIRLENWRQRIGFVSQDLFLLHSSVAENITFGRSGYSQLEIQKAAEIANAHSFIEELPQGYETVVGERGMKLSGGQQQRIAIARAILQNPEILIFDEATSFLDTESEKLVQQAIGRISEGRTVILIAHRLTTIWQADKIIVLDRGRVVEEGSPEQLLQGRGRYFQLIASTAEEKVHG